MINCAAAPVFCNVFKWFARALLLACFFSSAHAQSPNLLGKYCWTVTVTDSTVANEPPLPFNFTITTNIVDMGNGSYALTGYVLDPPDNPAIFGGVGHMLNGVLYLNLSGSQSHAAPAQDRDTSILHAEMNPTNFTGTFYEIGHDFNVGTRSAEPVRYSAGNIALASACL